MDGEGNGPPDYEAECKPGYIKFVYRRKGADGRVVRDLEIRDLIDDASPDFLVQWASFQTLCGIESVLKSIDLGVAYAIWSGLGTALVAAVGFLVFGEAVSAVRLVSIGLIILGVVGLQLSGAVR